jgi:hypothetical protein
MLFFSWKNNFSTGVKSANYYNTKLSVFYSILSHYNFHLFEAPFEMIDIMDKHRSEKIKLCASIK